MMFASTWRRSLHFTLAILCAWIWGSKGVFDAGVVIPSLAACSSTRGSDSHSLAINRTVLDLASRDRFQCNGNFPHEPRTTLAFHSSRRLAGPDDAALENALSELHKATKYNKNDSAGAYEIPTSALEAIQKICTVLKCDGTHHETYTCGLPAAESNANNIPHIVDAFGKQASTSTDSDDVAYIRLTNGALRLCQKNGDSWPTNSKAETVILDSISYQAICEQKNDEPTRSKALEGKHRFYPYSTQGSKDKPVFINSVFDAGGCNKADLVYETFFQRIANGTPVDKISAPQAHYSPTTSIITPLMWSAGSVRNKESVHLRRGHPGSQIWQSFVEYSVGDKVDGLADVMYIHNNIVSDKAAVVFLYPTLDEGIVTSTAHVNPIKLQKNIQIASEDPDEDPDDNIIDIEAGKIYGQSTRKKCHIPRRAIHQSISAYR
eukprot:GHVT01039333.1.p1 GENE.GHVT01039333.1~~GHVT01039333.1.p1  ORF type:complete len:435 (-),score=14.75 GHVT01039333.1:1236-2540(-)